MNSFINGVQYCYGHFTEKENKMSSIELISIKTKESIFEGYSFLGEIEDGEGKVIEKYSRKNVQYTMTVEKKNGVKHGKAEMVDEDGCFIASFTYTNGNLTGPCKLCNHEGIKQFEGTLLLGEKNGYCREYDQQGDEIFEGEYRNGKRIPYFEEHPEQRGFYIERSRKDLHEIAYTQYNPKTRVKNGICYLLDSSGKITKEVMMHDGKEVGVKKEFNGSEMVEYGENGNVVYVGCYDDNWKKGFQRHGHGIEYAGNSKDKSTSEIVYEGEFVNGKRCVTFSKVESGLLHGYYNEVVSGGKIKSTSQMQSKTFIKNGRSIEFSLETKLPVSEKWFENGKIVYERIRVDGNVMSEYDEGGNLLYKGGFKYKDGEFNRHGEGKEYEGDKVIKYNGRFANDCYEGKGVLYRNGHAYFKGEWRCGYPEGEGSLYNEDGNVKLKGNWHVGYLDGIDYLTGEKRGFCSCFRSSGGKGVSKKKTIMGGSDGKNRKESHNGKSKFMRWILSLNKSQKTWLVIIVTLFAILISISLTTSMVLLIRALFGGGKLKIHNCMEYYHLNWVVKLVVKDLEFADGCCYYTYAPFSLKGE